MRIMSVEAIDPKEPSGVELLPGEAVAAAFRASTGAVLFTDRRILVVRRELVLFERTRITSYSYRAMRSFAALAGDPAEGCGDEMILMLGNDADSLHMRAADGTSFKQLERLLAERLI
jgi:hypothetical protein